LPNKLLNSLKKLKEKLFVQVDLHSLNVEYFNWFTGTEGKLEIIKNNIRSLIENGIRVRIAAIFTPKNVNELFEIGKWAHDNGAILYAPSIVTCVGRAANNQSNNLLLNDEESLIKFYTLKQEVKSKYPKLILDSEEPVINCGALVSEVTINSNGIIKLCNTDDQQVFKIDFGNVFEKNIMEIYDENIDFIQTLRKTMPPKKDSDTCVNCTERFFCSYCFVRGLTGASKMKDKCKWYSNLNPIIKNKLKLLS